MVGIRRPALDHEVVEGQRVRFGGKLLPELTREIDDSRPPLGTPYDSPYRGHMVRLEKSRDRAVRGDHEILDEVGRAVPHRLLDTGDLAVLRYRARLDCLDFERPVL